MAILHDDEDSNDVVAVATFTTTNKSCNFFILCIRGNEIPSKTLHIYHFEAWGLCKPVARVISIFACAEQTIANISKTWLHIAVAINFWVNSSNNEA